MNVFVGHSFFSLLIMARFIQGAGAAAFPALVMVVVARYIPKENRGAMSHRRAHRSSVRHIAYSRDARLPTIGYSAARPRRLLALPLPFRTPRSPAGRLAALWLA